MAYGVDSERTGDPARRSGSGAWPVSAVLRLALALALAGGLAASGSGAAQEEQGGAEIGFEPPAACAADEAGIAGVVRDAGTGIALPGARVTIRRGEAERAEPEAEPAEPEEWTVDSGPGGTFRLCGQPTGRVTLTADFQGTTSPPDTVEVGAGEEAERDLHVPLGRPARLEGRVSSGASRDPVAGALVSLEPLDLQTLTDSTGAFLLDSVPPAAYALAVHHASGIRVDSLEVRPGSRVRFEARLTERTRVLGSVWSGHARRPTENGPPEERGERPDGREEAEEAEEAEEVVPEERARDRPEQPDRSIVGAAFRTAGTILSPAQLRRWKASRLSQALTLVPGVELVRRCVEAASPLCAFLPRLSAEEGCAEAAVYLDGRRVPPGPLVGLVERLDVGRIGSLQVVEPGEALPESVGGGPAECGAVLVWLSGPGDGS